MPSLADLGSVFGQQPPAGFTLGQLQLEGGIAQGEADLGRQRVLRNFSQFDLPDLYSGQGAKGAYNTSATWDKAKRLGTGANDRLEDIQAGLARTQAGLAGNSLLAQTGIQMSGY